MRTSQRIALIGLPGSGKSSVGRQLARRLSTTFADSDAVIEKNIGESIRSFFAREGEETFRDIEQRALADLCDQTGIAVLATGGGAVLRQCNRMALAKAFCVVYLRTYPVELYRRLRHDNKRPLLQVDDPKAALKSLYDERDPLYREIADFVIDTGRPAVPMLVSTILMQLELAGWRRPPAGTDGALHHV